LIGIGPSVVMVDANSNAPGRTGRKFVIRGP
jgi:hypothetical protein